MGRTERSDGIILCVYYTRAITHHALPHGLQACKVDAAVETSGTVLDKDASEGLHVAQIDVQVLHVDVRSAHDFCGVDARAMAALESQILPN